MDLTGRFKVFVADKYNPTTWLEARRLRPITARRQSKSLGGADFELIQNVFPTIVNEENPEEIIYADDPSFYGAGNYVKIIDTEINDSAVTTGNVVFYGVFKPGNEEKFYRNVDSNGIISADEVGWLLKKEIIRFYFDDRGTKISNPPPFNPVVNGRFCGNRANEQNQFTTDQDALIYSTTTTVSGGDWNATAEEVNKHVFSRKDVLDAIFAGQNTSRAYQITYPSKNNTIYSYFTEKTTQSFENYIGKSVMEALDDLIEDPMSYFIDYNISADNFELIIYNKSDVDVSQKIPGTTGYQINLKDTIPISKIEINDIQEEYDQVIVRGAPIMCCGAVTPWELDDQDTIEKNWSVKAQNNYVNGQDSISPLTEESDLDNADNFRRSIPDVYRWFKFKLFENEEQKNILAVVDDAGQKDGTLRTQYAFFPKFEMQENDTIYTTPIVKKDFLTTKTHHSTPGPLSVKWSDKLPIYFKRTTFDADGVEQPEKELVLSDPILLAPSINTTFQSNNIAWFDLINANKTQTVKLTQNGFDIKLTADLPQLFAMYDTSKRLWEGLDPYSDGEWLLGNSPGVSKFNPDDDDTATQEAVKTHWKRFVFVIAGFSNQRLEISQNKTGVASPVNPYVIEDDSLQIWFVHRGVPIQMNRANNTPVRLDEDVLTRNDLGIAFETLQRAYNFLMRPRKSGKIEMPLVQFSWNKPGYTWFNIGNVIKDIVDDDTTTRNSLNSPIESITWNFVNQNPTIEISTEIPKIPALKRAKTDKSLGVTDGVNYGMQTHWNTSKSKQSKTEIKIEGEMSVGEATIKGLSSGGSSPVNLKTFVVQGFNDNVHYFPNLTGVKLADEPSDWGAAMNGHFADATTEMVSGNPETLPDGLGIGTDILTGEQEYIANFNDIVFIYSDIPKGQKVRCYSTETISVSSGSLSGQDFEFYLIGDIV